MENPPDFYVDPIPSVKSHIEKTKKLRKISEAFRGAYGTRTRKCPQFDFQIVTTTVYLFCNEYVTNI